jgi:hypothetical protein
VPHDAYPSGDDLAAFLSEFGVEVTNTAALDTLAAAGVATFEAAVGRVMLAGEERTDTFDPPTDGLLDLSADLAAPPTSITYQPYTSTPQSFVIAQDYSLLPQNALARGKPIERIRLSRAWCQPYGFGQVDSIAVTGLWGYGLTIPDDAWLAMLSAGASAFFDKGSLGGGGAIKSWKEGNSSATYAEVTAADRAALKQAFLIDTPAVIATYRKVLLLGSS